MTDPILEYVGLVLDVHLIVVFLSLIPLFLNIKYWRQTGLVDYLLVSLSFFVWSIYTLVEIFWSDQLLALPLGLGFFIFNVFNNLDAFPLFLVAVRAKYLRRSDIPRWIYGIGTISILLALIAVIDNSNSYWYFLDGQFVFGTGGPSADNALTFVSTSWIWTVWINRIMLHATIAYTYLTTKHYRNRRTNISRWFWIIGSILWVWIMLWLMVPSGFFGYAQDLSRSYIEVLAFTPFVIVSIMVVINHTVFPEAVVITHSQILRAKKLYSKVGLKDNIVNDLGISFVKSYLDDLPEELLEIEVPAE